MKDYKELILSALEILRKNELNNKETFKARAYQKVITNIKGIDGKITSFNDLEHIEGIGDKIEKKIKEIFETGKLQKVETILQSDLYQSDLYQSEKLKILEELQTIHGIGPVKAKELIEKFNVKSIEELKILSIKDSSLLNQSQKVGLKYVKDLVQRIPRSEMDEHYKFITNLIDKISGGKLVSTVVGSYRRLSESSGDIDVIITSKSTKTVYIEMVTLYNNCINQLKKCNYLVEILASGNKKCLGICKLGENAVNRRIDLLLTLPSEFYFSILYFTGSQTFNIKMRSRALELGYSLNEFGLFNKSDNKSEEKVKLVVQSEKDIFDFLKMEYVAPVDRI